MENLFKLGMVLLWIACADAGQFYSHLRNGKRATVEHITLPHDQAERNPTSPESIFKDQMDFRVTLSSRDDINLHLKLNKNQIGKVLVKVVSQDGTEFVDSTKQKDFRFYQVIGDEHGASVMVRCENYKPPCYIAGSFYYNSIEYVIDPDTNIANKVSKLPYTVYEVKPTNNTHAHDHDTVKVVVDDSREEMRQSLSAVLLDLIRLQSSRKTKRQTRRKQYKIELEIVVDDSIYAYWLRKMSNNDAAAVEKIEQYMEQVANNMDLRFSTATTATMEIDIVPLVITIIKDRSAAGWITRNIVYTDSKGGEAYNADKALDEFAEWSSKNKNRRADAVICLSRRDMWSEGKRSGEGTIGLATSIVDETGKPKSGLCTDNAVSINEDLRDGDTSSTASHELAHNMGVDHDGNEGCNDDDLYVMASSAGYVSDASKAKNSWTFSSCSVKRMEKVMESVPKDSKGKTCLQRHTYDVTEYNTIQTSELLGEIYSTDEQCELLIGKGSTHCKNVDVKDNEICWNGLPCSTTGNECIFKYPLSGSRCGNTKKCYQGRCVDGIREIETQPAKQPSTEPSASPTATSTMPWSTSTSDTTTEGTHSSSVNNEIAELIADICAEDCSCAKDICVGFDEVPVCNYISNCCN